jgi:hypothetical protein
MLPGDDGAPAWCANLALWRTPRAGTPRLFQLSEVPRVHWNFPALMEVLGFTADWELMAWLKDGFRFRAVLPMSVRVMANTDTLAPNVRAIADDIGKLADAGLYTVIPLCSQAAPVLTLDGPCPLAFLPTAVTSEGAVDKATSATEKRRIDNAKKPYPGRTRERNHPHGAPDGETARAFNELTGNDRKLKDARTWPPETKHTTRDAYKAAAPLKRMAHIAGVPLVAFKNDYRWMFYMFTTHECEWPWTCLLVVVRQGK